MRIPIACTLTPESAADRVEEWRAFFANWIEAAEKGSGELRLRLNRSESALVLAADLAEREKACCGFFEFSIELQPEARWLVVRVPDDAAGVLDDIVALLRTSCGPSSASALGIATSS